MKTHVMLYCERWRILSLRCLTVSGADTVLAVGRSDRNTGTQKPSHSPLAAMLEDICEILADLAAI